LASNGVTYNANGGTAKSEGAEVSVSASPLQGLKIAAWVAYDDAKLTTDTPPKGIYGQSGDPLPYSSKYSGHLSLDQQFYVGSGWTPSWGAAASYVGERTGPFLNTPGPRQGMPAYTQIDAHATLEYKSWTLNLFGTNLSDQRGILSGGVGSINSTAFNYIQPRTIGLSIKKNF
jgi:outer membrane receptor protein involved in Fe transport